MILEVETAEEHRKQIVEAVPTATVEVLENPSPCAQHSLLIDRASLLPAARFLKSSGFDYCSNVTGVDHPERVETVKEKVTRKGEDGDVEETVEREVLHPGFLEVVYHLYSVKDRRGPLVIRVRTGDRAENVEVPSLTPVWRSCELQEREVFDLYGVRFAGHPDLRRLLMWDEFVGHPMRKDYVDPDDFEYEPTPHGEVIERSADHPAGRKIDA